MWTTICYISCFAVLAIASTESLNPLLRVTICFGGLIVVAFLDIFVFNKDK
jgi:hypothetical protein